MINSRSTLIAVSLLCPLGFPKIYNFWSCNLMLSQYRWVSNGDNLNFGHVLYWIKSVAVIGIAGEIYEKKYDMSIISRTNSVVTERANPVQIMTFISLACCFLTNCLLTVLIGKLCYLFCLSILFYLLPLPSDKIEAAKSSSKLQLRLEEMDYHRWSTNLPSHSNNASHLES